MKIAELLESLHDHHEELLKTCCRDSGKPAASCSPATPTPTATPSAPQLGPGAPAAQAGQGRRRSGTATRCRPSTARCPAASASTSARSRRAASPTTSTRWSCSSARASTAPASRRSSPACADPQHRSPPRQPALRRRQLGRRRRRRPWARWCCRLAQRPQARDRPRHRRLPLPRAGHDTGGFRFSNATAARLRGRGAPGADAARRPSRSRSGSTRASPRRCSGCWARCWGRSRSHGDGRIATALLTPEMFERAGASHGDAEGLVDYPRSIAGVDAVALLRVLGEDRRTRSRCAAAARFDVERIARKHGGGGHRAAAGVRSDRRARRAAARGRRRARGASCRRWRRHEARPPAGRQGGRLHLARRGAGGRRRIGQKKIGHCGTLDPDATGLLLLTLGRGTRLTRFLIRAPKVYEGDDPLRSGHRHLRRLGHGDRGGLDRRAHDRARWRRRCGRSRAT